MPTPASHRPTTPSSAIEPGGSHEWTFSSLTTPDGRPLLVDAWGNPVEVRG
jgi:hypothetical protein